MAARLGLRPWERDRMAPAEVFELWDGYLWRHQFEMVALAQGVTWLRAMLDDKASFTKVAESMGIDLDRLRKDS